VCNGIDGRCGGKNGDVGDFLLKCGHENEILLALMCQILVGTNKWQY
jgi:hypothetical protein